MSKAKKIWDKLLYGLGFDIKEDDEEHYLDDREVEYEEENLKKKANIVGLPANKQQKVVILEPKAFEDSQKVSEHLKARKQVITNLDHLDRETAQRIIDFLSGVTFALNGSMQKLGQNIFLFTPSNVIITGEVKQDPANKVINISWEKNLREE
ncbi:MAG: cell division protein SepF [Bacillota bacterium]|nr:cell division protein SepF [Bacillota bacterium]